MNKRVLWSSALAFLGMSTIGASHAASVSESAFYSLKAADIDNNEIDFATLKDKVGDDVDLQRFVWVCV